MIWPRVFSSLVLAIAISIGARGAGWEDTNPEEVAAFESGNLPAIKRIIKENDNYKNSRNILTSAFALTVGSGKPDAIEHLIEIGWLTSYREETDYPIILFAAQHGKVPVIELLLKNGEDPNARDRFADGGNTPLHLAAAGGRLEAVKYLLEFGASPAVKNNSGRNPLENLVYQHQLSLRNGSQMPPEFVADRMKVIQLLEQHTPRDQKPPAEKAVTASTPPPDLWARMDDTTIPMVMVAGFSLLLGALFVASRALVGRGLTAKMKDGAVIRPWPRAASATAGAILGVLIAFGAFVTWGLVTGGLASLMLRIPARGIVAGLLFVAAVAVLGGVIGYPTGAAWSKRTRVPILSWALAVPAAAAGWIVGLATGILFYATLGMCPDEFGVQGCRSWEGAAILGGLTVGCFLFVLLPAYAVPSHRRLVALTALAVQSGLTIVIWRFVPSITWHFPAALTLPAIVALGVVHILSAGERARLTEHVRQRIRQGRQ